MAEKPKLPFLVMPKNHLSLAKARSTVIALVHRCGLSCPEGNWENLVVHITIRDKPPLNLPFTDMVAEARETGIVRHLQRHFDRSDSIFGGTLDDFCTPNYQMRIKSEWGGFSIENQGPCRTACPVTDLTEDILEARRLACAHSNEYDFVQTCRYFRNYLSACISLVDAFINRNIHVARLDGFSSPEFDQLQEATKMEKKLELLWKVCSSEDISMLVDSRHYCQFQELRKKRNVLLHAVDPVTGYSLADLQVYLNKVRSGIGELLLLFRTAHKHPTLGFIERLRTAPKVEFHKVHLRTDGDRVEKIKVD